MMETHNERDPDFKRKREESVLQAHRKKTTILTAEENEKPTCLYLEPKGINTVTRKGKQPIRGAGVTMIKSTPILRGSSFEVRRRVPMNTDLWSIIEIKRMSSHPHFL